MQQQHEEDLANQQQRFLEEKYRLQKEAARRITEVSKNAHDEAVRCGYYYITMSLSIVTLYLLLIATWTVRLRRYIVRISK